jgi:hypothetical protein
MDREKREGSEEALPEELGSALEINEGVAQMAYENPAYGQSRASNELRKRGISSWRVRSRFR